MDEDRDPTKEEMFAYARYLHGLPGGKCDRVTDRFFDELCMDFVRSPCAHVHDAYSLALDGEDVDELL